MPSSYGLPPMGLLNYSLEEKNTVHIQDICFTQDSIRSTFTDGSHLEDLFTELVEREKTVNDVETISCVEYKSKYWVFYGNRRLFLYKILEEANIIDKVRVQIEQKPKHFWTKFTTKNGGKWVCCRDNPHLAHELMAIANENRKLRATESYFRNESMGFHKEYVFWRTVQTDDDLDRFCEETRRQCGGKLITRRDFEEDGWWWQSWCAIL